MLIRLEDEKPIKTKVTKREISIESQILRIKEKLKIEKKVKFEDLFQEKTKSYVVVTFLAILEMARYGEIKLYQENL